VKREPYPPITEQIPMNLESLGPVLPTITTSRKRQDSGMGKTVLLQMLVFGMFWLGFLAGEWWDDRQRAIQAQSENPQQTVMPAPTDSQITNPQPNANN
jgi:hypothetical protein